MYVLAKDLKDNKSGIFPAQDFFIIDKNGKRNNFNPRNTNDYKERTHYGRVVNGMIRMHYIRKLAESKDELEVAIKSKRVPDPSRQSLTPVELPLSLVSNEEEGCKAKHISQQQVAKSKAATASASSVLARNKALNERSSRNSDVSAPRRSPRKPATTTKPETEVQPLSCFQCAERMETNTKLIIENSALKVENSSLRSENEKLKIELSNSKDLLEEITKTQDMIRGMQQQSAGTGGRCSSYLENFSLIPVEENWKDEVEIYPHQLYAGEGLVLNKEDIEGVIDEETLRARVFRLCKIFYGDKLHEHSLSGKVSRNGIDTVQQIPKVHVKAMMNLLRVMPWKDNDYYVEKSKVLANIRHAASEACTLHLTSKGLIEKKVKKSQDSGLKKDKGRKRSSVGVKRKCTDSSSEQATERQGGALRKRKNSIVSSDSQGEADEAESNKIGDVIPPSSPEIDTAADMFGDECDSDETQFFNV